MADQLSQFLLEARVRKRMIVGFGRLGVSKLFQLILPTILLGRTKRRILLRFFVSCGGARQYPLQCLRLGG